MSPKKVTLTPRIKAEPENVEAPITNGQNAVADLKESADDNRAERPVEIMVQVRSKINGQFREPGDVLEVQAWVAEKNIRRHKVTMVF